MSEAVSIGRARGLSGSTLKIIAMVTMFIDHVGAAVVERGFLYPQLQAEGVALNFAVIKSQFPTMSAQLQQYLMMDAVLRLIGRLAFPIFCFLLVEGFLHTRSKGHYAARLAAVAVLSEAPFDYAIYGGEDLWAAQNVLWTLLFGLLGLWAGESLCTAVRKRFGSCPQGLALVGILPFMGLAAFCHTDYSFFGVALIGLLYVTLFAKVKNPRLVQSGVGGLACAFEFTAPLAFVLTYFYNGRRGLNVKWIFYFFYPVHLALLYGVRVWLY